MRILAVDPGQKRLGIAISDPSGTIASPLKVVQHIARSADAAAIIQLAEEHQAGMIVIGENLDVEGEPTLQSILAARLAETIRANTSLPGGNVGRKRQYPSRSGSPHGHGCAQEKAAWAYG
jgi:putative holliday junction resolvase